jgi:hypothetical protein
MSVPPTKFLNLPPGHAAHELEPPLASTYRPLPQGAQVALPTPANPDVHSSQLLWPWSGWYLPAEQSVHSVERIEPLNLPSSQSEQDVEPAAEYLPDEQLKQYVLAADEAALPAAQSEQEEAAEAE